MKLFKVISTMMPIDSFKPMRAHPEMNPKIDRT